MTIFAAIHSMERLQEQWFGTLCGEVGADNFQIIQPACLSQENDAGLWQLLNRIPPVSQTFNRCLWQDETFFDNYLATICQLDEHKTCLKQVIGDADYTAWCRHLNQIQPKPEEGRELALAFRNWAMGVCPDKAEQGASAILQNKLSKGILNAILPYTGLNAKPVDFIGSFAQLLKTLAMAGGKEIHFDSRSGNAGTGIQGGGAYLWGLWADLIPYSRLSRQFACNPVTMTLKMGAVAPWIATPGDWYNSSLLNQAYASKSSPPWKTDPEPDWNLAFGPDGILKNFIASVFFADDVTMHLTSHCRYTDFDRAIIAQHAKKGLWPLYVPSCDWADNAVVFGDSAMDITVAVKPGHPIVLGATILGIGQYIR